MAFMYNSFFYISMWNCTISEYSFQNLNEIVWRKSEKFENEAQPSFKFFTIYSYSDNFSLGVLFSLKCN